MILKEGTLIFEVIATNYLKIQNIYQSNQISNVYQNILKMKGSVKYVDLTVYSVNKKINVYHVGKDLKLVMVLVSINVEMESSLFQNVMMETLKMEMAVQNNVKYK